MKRTTLSLVMLACSVVALLIGAAFTVVSSASAQLGNSGVPVRCTHATAIGSTIGGSGYEQPLRCYRPDGTYFDNVPSSNYLLVTDVLILEQDGIPCGRNWKVALEVKDGSGVQYSVPFWVKSDPIPESFSEHFSVPYFVLGADDYLNAHNLVTDTYNVNMRFYISGILTTNYSYLPQVTR